MRTIGIIMGIISLPMLVFFTFSLIKSQTSRHHDGEMLVYERAVHLSQKIGSVLLDRLSALDHIGFAYNELSQDTLLRNQFIQHFLASHDEVTDIAVVDSRGKEIMHKRAGTGDAIPLVDRSQNIEFLTLKDKGYYLGPLYLSQGKPLVLFGRAIMSSDGKSLRGGMLALLKADFILDELKNASTQDGVTAFMVNEKGEITAHPTVSYISEAKDFSHNPAVALAIGHDALSARIYTNELTERVVGTAAPLAMVSDAGIPITTNWSVILEMPAAVVFSGAVAERNAAILLLIFLLACVAVAAVVLAPRINTPLDAVVRALKELNAGNIDYRLLPSDRADLNAVTSGVNILAETLMRVTQDLAEEKRAAVAEREKIATARVEAAAGEVIQTQYHQIPADIQETVGEQVEPVKEIKRKRVAVIFKKPKIHI